MRVFVAGGTGVIGRYAVAELVRAGHEVSVVTRSREKAAMVEGQGARPSSIDPWNAEALRRAVGGHDAVVNLATAIPPVSKAMLPGAWRQNDRIRSELSRALVEAALAVGARRYVQESLAFTYRDGGDRWLDEDAPIDASGQTATTRDAEAQSDRFAREGGAGVTLRFGLLVDPRTSGAQIVEGARVGRVPFFGDPAGYTPLLHPMDAGSAVAAALTAASGAYNVVESDPRTREEHARALGLLVGREVRLLPRPLGRLPRIRILTRSQRVSNRRLREATGWSPRWASHAEGWASIARPSSGEAAA